MYEKFTDRARKVKAPASQEEAANLVAVDVGNSQIKLGQFIRGTQAKATVAMDDELPEPIATLELPIANESGHFEVNSLTSWCESHLSPVAHWLIGSVHRGASDLLRTTISDWTNEHDSDWTIRSLTYKDFPFAIRVDEPERVGIDRLLAAVGANRLRAPDRAAIVVDLGTAITVDLIEADGAFAGGAILPGIGMAGRALADQTDALPHVVLEHTETPPSPLGKTTIGAIEAGLYWGAIGAVGEIVARLTKTLPMQPDLFITGGAARTVANSLDESMGARFVPHLVLSGIALIDEQGPGSSRGSAS